MTGWAAPEKKDMAGWGKPAKIALGAATLWPIVYLFIFMGFFFLSFMRAAQQAGAHGQAEPFPAFFVFFALHFATMLEIMVLMVFYIVDVMRTPRIAENMKAVWVIILFLGNMIAMPIYWFLYVWSPQPVLTNPSVPPHEMPR